MAEWSENENPYTVLGLKADCSKDELKKRYRKLVLTKHPDKQPGNEAAAEEFIRIQRAYEILTDDKAKAAWDALQRAQDVREERHSQKSEKRRKMAEDLERREKEYDTQRNQYKAAQDRLREEVARVRREAAVKAEKARQAAIAREMQRRQESNATASTSSDRTLKVSWDADISTYTSAQLRELFSTHGDVEDVIFRESKKKKGKGSALVVMSDVKGASNALHTANGDKDNPLLVLPLKKVAIANGENGSANGHTTQPTQGSQPAWGKPSLLTASQLPKVDASKVAFPGGSSAFPSSHGGSFTAYHQGRVFPGFPAGRDRENSAAAGFSPQQSASQLGDKESDVLAKMRKRAQQDKSQKTSIS